MVLAAGNADSPEGRAALEMLCRLYWYPLYAHIRGRGFSPEDAQDLTQEFMASLLRRRSLSDLAPERGRFRSYLLTAVKYFLADHHDKVTAARRGGGVPPISLDAMDAEARYASEPRHGETPDRAFDRRWAAVLMESVFDRLTAQAEAEGKAAMLAVLKPFLAGEPEAGEYERAGATLGQTANAVAQQVRRLRQRCRRLLIEAAAETLAVPAEAEQELRALFG